MKRILGGLLSAALVTGACSSESSHIAGRVQSSMSMTTVHGGAAAGPAARSLDDVVATVNGQPITLRRFLPPLLESHGRQLLERMALLEYIRQDTAKEGIVVAPDDIARQRELTLQAMMHNSKAEEKTQENLDAAEAKGDKPEVQRIRAAALADREQFLDQFLVERNVSATDFNITIEINTYLRKKAERMVEGFVTEERIKTAFGFQYGETVRTKYIKLPNMQQVTVAKHRLDSGDKFEDVARDMSTDRESGALGGETPAFSRADPNLPESVKDVAFSLKPNEVSDPITLGTSLLLVKMIEKIPPKVIKYETVRESLRKQLYDAKVGQTMNELRDRYTKQTVMTLKIENPILKEQFQKAQDRELHSREEISRAMERDRLVNEAPPTTNPGTLPLPKFLSATRPTTAPASGQNPPALPGPPAPVLPWP